MKEEEQNTDIRRKLRNLPGIKASGDFENNLLRRINALGAEESVQKTSIKDNEKAAERTSIKSGFFDGFLGKSRPVWFIPALSTAVLAVVALTVTLYINSGKNSNIREAVYTQNPSVDTITSGNINGISKDNGIPGKDIANDMAIGKAENPEQPSEIDRGQMEFETRADSKTGEVMKKTETLRESQPVFEYQNGKSKINDSQRINIELPKKEGGIIPNNESGNVPQKDEKRNDNILNRELQSVQPAKDKANSPPSGVTKGNEEQSKAAEKVKAEDKSGEPVKSSVKDKDTSKDKKKDIISKPPVENKDNKKEVRQKPPVDIKKQEPRNPPVDIKREEPKKEEPKKPPVEIKKEDSDKSK